MVVISTKTWTVSMLMRLSRTRVVPMSMWFSREGPVLESTGTGLARALFALIPHAIIPPFSVVLVPPLAPTPCFQLQIPHQSTQPLQLLVSTITLPVFGGTQHCPVSLVRPLSQARFFFSSPTLPILTPFLSSFLPYGVPRRSYWSALGLASRMAFGLFPHLSLSRTTAS